MGQVWTDPGIPRNSLIGPRANPGASVSKWDQIGPVWASLVGIDCRLSRSKPSRTIKGDRRSVMGGMAWLGQKMGQGGIKLDHCGLVWEQTGSLWNSVEPFIIKL